MSIGNVFKKILSLFIVSLMVFMVACTATKVEVITPEPLTPRTFVISETASVLVGDQLVSDEVTGISGFLDKPGFVVVHLIKDGQFAEVVGNSVQLTGEFSNLNIPITEKTGRLNVMLHYDTNNNGLYEFGQIEGVDGPTIVDGNVIMTEISATGKNPKVTASDQQVATTVSGISGFLDKPGFVVVHLVKNGNFAEVVGNSQQLKGSFNGISVPISAKTDKLNVMLHYDTNGNGIYEFGSVEGADGPVIVSGQVAMTEISASRKSTVTAGNQQVTSKVSGVSGFIDKPGFVVVHLVKDGKFAEVVGNSRVVNGAFNDLSIGVTEKTERLNVMLHYDTNGNGIYEFGSVEGADGPVIVDGQVAMTEINAGNTVTKTPRVSVNAQLVDNQVSGISGFLDKPGFVVVHLVKDGQFAEVVGNSRQLNGAFTGVNVGISEKSNRLNVMLHYDTNNNGIYEFGKVDGADGPVAVNGQVAMTEFNIQNPGAIADSSSADGSSVKEFRMTAERFKFTPNIISVNQGDTVRLSIESIDTTHGFSIPEFGVSKTLSPGSTVNFEFVADKKGEFPFFCTVVCGSGHGGMNGNLVVR